MRSRWRTRLRVLLALGGSTNAVIHLTAIAGRAGVKVSLEQLNELSELDAGAGQPQAGRQRLHGGFLRRRRHGRAAARAQAAAPPRLHDGDRRDAGRAACRAKRRARIDRSIIAARDEPFEPQGGLVALFGNLAPEGAILKRSAADAKLFEHEGRAVVFASLADLAARIDDPALDVTPQDVLVLQNAGPHAPECMPEAGYLPIPKKLAQRGVKDMIRISDARMSGTAFGTIVLHVTPDSASGGPLGAGAQRRPHPAFGQGAAHRCAGRGGRAEAPRRRREVGARRSPSAAMPSSMRGKFSAPTTAATSRFLRPPPAASRACPGRRSRLSTVRRPRNGDASSSRE